MITIDSQDIRETWALEPVYDNFYSALMKDSGIKDRITADYSNVNGLTVQSSTAYTKSQDIIISFFCDTFAKYEEFLTYCVTQKVINMYVSEIDETLKLEYKACTSFNENRIYNTFAVKFREANPTDRS